MRKLILLILTLFLLTLAGSAYAQEEKVLTGTGYVIFKIGDNRCFVKGPADKFGPPALKRPAFDASGVTAVTMDAAPYVKDGRTFVPVRYLSNALGVSSENIGWDSDAQKVTLSEPGLPVVELTVGKAEVVRDGQSVPGVDVAPEVVPPGRTTLPARFVAEALGFKVKWLPDQNLVVAVKGKDLTEQQVDELAKEAATEINTELSWKPVSYKDSPSALIPPGAEKDGNIYYFGNSTIVKFDSGPDAYVIRYPCKEYSNEKADQLAKELLLANIGDADLVQQIWDYGAQKTTRWYMLQWKIFPGVGNYKEIWVSNADGCIAVRIFPKK
jgi:hypothetical protein